MEIKLRLPNKEAHDAVAAQLKDSFRETHQQENFFFDGVKGELSSQRVVLRCRFYNKDKRAIVTLKVLHSIIITASEPPIVTLKVLSCRFYRHGRVRHRDSQGAALYCCYKGESAIDSRGACLRVELCEWI